MGIDHTDTILGGGAGGGGGGLSDVVDDTTPQLGGNLDVNSNQIVSVSGGDLELHSDNDVNVTLGDASGADDFNIKDSGDATIFSVNSDGQVALSSHIDFTAESSPTHSEGLVYYDSAEKALSYYNDESDVTLNVGRELFVRVRNETGSTITNGQAVYVSGSEGGGEDRLLVALAQSDSQTTSQLLGLATHDIENNTYGYVTQFGFVNDLNTASFSAGDALFVDSATAGGLTNTEPTSPNFRVFVGYVDVSSASVGSIFVSTIGNTSGTTAGTATQLSVLARKDSAGTINDGEAVYITGYNSGQDVILVEAARSDSSSTMPAIGLAEGSFTNSSTGTVIVSGRLASQDTSAYSVGDALYVDPTTAGALTNTKPVGNNLIQKVGLVSRSNVSNGVIDVVGAGRSNDTPNFTAADKFWYGGTGGVTTEGDITSFGRSLVDDASASAARTTLGAIADIVEDTTPQLGGQLDVNGNAIGDGTRELVTFTEDASAVNHVNIENQATGSGPIISAAGDDTNVDLNLAGKGTGNISLGNMSFDADQTIGAGQDNYVLTYDNAGGLISLEEAAGGGGGGDSIGFPGDASTGGYYKFFGCDFTESTFSQFANYGFWAPVWLPADTYTRLGVEIGTAHASDTIYLGIYEVDTDGQPGALVVSATPDATSTGATESTISEALDGWYYFYSSTSASFSPVPRALINRGSNHLIGHTAGTAGSSCLHRATSGGGGGSAPDPAPTTALNNQAYFTQMWVRVV